MSGIFRMNKEQWRKLRASQGYRNFLLFLLFVAISALFWFFLAMNDSVQRTFDVQIKIENKPDSVTFITDPPSAIHVNVRAKGTTLFRSGVMRQPVVTLNFKEFAQDGVFRLPSTDFYASLRSLFGNSAQIASTSVDSLNLRYTLSPGKRVPVKLRVNAEASLGNVIAGPYLLSSKDVLIYSADTELDTINDVVTQHIVKRNLGETTKVSVQLEPIRGVKIVPDRVTVTIPVEPLVKKQSGVEIEVINVPAGESLLLFPSKAEVSYFIPMSRFSDNLSGFRVVADYSDLNSANRHSHKIHIRVVEHPDVCVSVSLPVDSVEYTIMK